MKSIGLGDARRLFLQAFGLPSDTTLDSAAALACSLRRAAGFRCPATRRMLVQVVLESLQGLLDTPRGELRERLYDILEDLISHGDLLELEDVTDFEADGAQVFRAPPGFVARQSGTIIALGVAPDALSPFPVALHERVTHNDHVRTIEPSGEPNEGVREELLDLGFIEIALESWLKEPARMSAADHLRSLQDELAATPRCGDVDGLTLLDPKTSVRYYRGRWTEPSTAHSGFFVGRRPQAFGADLWCYVEVEGGQPVRLLDLLHDRVGRGCDRAWRLQAAIDQERGSPQICEFRETSSDQALLSFFHPVPQWARRRWAALGRPRGYRGALFGYEIPLVEWSEERKYLREALWMIVHS